MPSLNKTDQKYLERLAQGSVSFTYAVDLNGGRTAKLVRSSVSSSLQKHYHRLAVAGYVAEVVSGCGGRGDPAEHTVTFTLTALGRKALGLRAPRAPTVNRSRSLTESELLAEGAIE